MNAAFTVHASVETKAGLVSLTDIAVEDIDALVHYWHGGVADLEFLAIDMALLGTPQDTYRRFEVAIRNGSPDQANLAFAIRLNNELAGYTLLNRYSPEVNYSHWHITQPGLRAGGLSTALYPYRIKTYFDLTPITRLIHQTRTRNIGVNRMLDKYLPVVETSYVEHPDGVAGPGEFHHRYVRASDIPGFFEKAASLQAAPS